MKAFLTLPFDHGYGQKLGHPTGKTDFGKGVDNRFNILVCLRGPRRDKPGSYGQGA